MRKIIVSALSISVVVGLVILINGKIGEKKEAPAPKVTVIKDPLVKTQVVSNRLLLPSILVQGKVNASEIITVALEGKGTLQSSVGLSVGTEFKKGQTIVYVDDTQTKSNFRSLLSNYERNLTQVLVDIEVEHPAELNSWSSFRNDVMAGLLPELPKSKNQKLINFLSSKGIFTEYYDLKAVQSSLTKRFFRAPFNCVVTESLVQAGSFINGNTVVCKIVPSNVREVSFSLPSDFNRIKKGSKVTVITKENKQLTGVIDRESTVISSSSQQAAFFVKLRTNALKIDEFVTVKIPTSQELLNVGIVANPMVYKDQVYVISNDSTLQVKNIRSVGIRNDSLLVSGLTDGQRVLSEAFTNFKEGQKVRF